MKDLLNRQAVVRNLRKMTARELGGRNLIGISAGQVTVTGIDPRKLKKAAGRLEFATKPGGESRKAKRKSL